VLGDSAIYPAMVIKQQNLFIRLCGNGSRTDLSIGCSSCVFWLGRHSSVISWRYAAPLCCDPGV